jgi:hypothetical protein
MPIAASARYARATLAAQTVALCLDGIGNRLKQSRPPFALWWDFGDFFQQRSA